MPSHISRSRLLGISVAIIVLVGGVYLTRTQSGRELAYQAGQIASPENTKCDIADAPSITTGNVTEERTIEMDATSEIELVRTFKSAGNDDYLLPSSGLVIDVCEDGKWETVYRADADKEAPESIELDTLDTASSKVLVVKKEYAGAGTSMEWEIITLRNGKANVYPRGTLLDGVLDGKNYQFMGYNEVHVERNMVVETVPGYSADAARCCPDLPTLKIFYQFTADKIRVVSTEVVPGTPKN
ncbi:MAG: hypothetical protein AAB343_02880 [Patescibacteria group bacterium]